MRTIQALRATLWCTLVAGVLGCSSDGTAPGSGLTPTTVTVLGDAQTAMVGTALGNPIGVSVADQHGNPLAGIVVRFVVTAGGGHVGAASIKTDAAGVASTTWTLGLFAGVNSNSVGADVAGYAGADPALVASATAGPPAALTIVSGDAQTGMIGTALPAPLRARVDDAYGNTVAGVDVTWTEGPEGGLVASIGGRTTTAGIATATRILGNSPGDQQTVASLTGVSPAATATFVSSATPLVRNYSIVLRFLGAFSVARQSVFRTAAQQWAGIVVGDLPNIPATPVPAEACGPGSPAFNENIDDVLVFARIDSIDGPLGILGAAGPCFIRTGTKHTAVGFIYLDSADVTFMESNTIFPAVVLHELGHVIGFGSLWSDPPSLLINSVVLGGTDPYFNGVMGILQFNASGGGGYGGMPVPVEASGGPGTQDAHWRESVMGKELMTGYVSLVANPLSAITVGSLADMGYLVSYVNADPYAVDPVNLRTGAAAGDFRLNEAAPAWPVKAIDASGRITRVR